MYFTSIYYGGAGRCYRGAGRSCPHWIPFQASGPCSNSVAFVIVLG